MKRTALFFSLILMVASLWGANLAIDEMGTLYSVTSASDEHANFLNFVVTYPDGTSENSIILGTYDTRKDEDPFLIYVPRYKKLYLTWSFGDSDYRNVSLMSYDIFRQEWGDATLISDRTLVKRFHSRSIYTTDQSGFGLLHVVWWEEYDDSFGDTVYTVIPFDEKDLDHTNRVTRSMNAYAGDHDPVDYYFPPSSYRFPNIWASGVGNQVTLLAPSPQTGYYSIISFDYDDITPDIVESDQRAHFPDIGVKFEITINSRIDTPAAVNSVYTSHGRMVFFWEGEQSINYVFYCNKLWSMNLTTPLKGVGPERLKTLFQSIIR